jgi:hypothetical protein
MWKEIAIFIRDRKFNEDEEHVMDIFDIQVHPF